MTVRLLDENTIGLEGHCPIEDAQILLEHLIERPDRAVDWRRCETAHTAVVQILMVSSAVLPGAPAGKFLQQHVASALRRLADEVRPFRRA